MVLTIFISVALISIIPLVITIRGRVSRSASLEQLQERLLDVDLAAFLNLMDESETTFLRRMLTPPSFRRVQRLRNRAALAYLKILLNNTAILMRIGDIARSSSDLKVAESGRVLAETALRTRMSVLRSYFTLLPQLVSPSAGWKVTGKLLSNYNELVSRLRDLGTAQPLVSSQSSRN
jgi:hypothetical protein